MHGPSYKSSRAHEDRQKDITTYHIKIQPSWLARYPLPLRCIHDNGGEFTGWEFQELLQLLHIEDVPTTSRNSTANAICVRMHQTVGNILRTLRYTNPPTTVSGAADLVDQALATAMHATSKRCDDTQQLARSAGVRT